MNCRQRTDGHRAWEDAQSQVLLGVTYQLPEVIQSLFEQGAYDCPEDPSRPPLTMPPAQKIMKLLEQEPYKLTGGIPEGRA